MTAFNSMNLHGVESVSVSEERYYKDTDTYVKTLVITDDDGNVTNINLFRRFRSINIEEEK
jgi:hypothetical protein